MARYKLTLDRRVRSKDLPGLPKTDAVRIAERIGRLADDPRPRGAVKLTDQPGYRVRQGNYRILYVIDDEAATVRVLAVDHRRDAYRR